jgi:nucleoside-diphosphate-sugar epimerase
MSKTSRTLLTGATGFIGSHLVNLLLNEGHRVAATFRGLKPKSSIRLPKSEQVEWIEVSDAEQWITTNRPEIIVHLATNYGKNTPPSKCIEDNVVFPLTLLEAACAVETPLFLNTATFFGKQKLNYPNMQFYTESKETFAAFATKYCANRVSRFMTLRLEHVYGEHDNSDKFIPFLMGELNKRDGSLRLTDGTQMRDFIHVEDVAAAYLTVIDNYEQCAVDLSEIQVGRGNSVSVRSFVETAALVTNSGVHLDFGALPQRDGEIMESTADNQVLVSLGWSAKVDMRQGIERIHSSSENQLV